jgi:TRAP-type C4-dicarboxylate transport system permease small subunit
MTAPKSRLKWFIDSFDRGTDLVVDRLCLGAAVAAVAMALLVVAAQVVFRYGLNDSLIWAEEFARFALIWAAFLGVPVAYRRGEHVGVTLLIENLPAVFARVLIFLTHILAIGFAVILAWEGWFLTLRVFARGEIANAMQVPIAWGYLAVPVGGVFLGLAAVAALLHGPGAAGAGDADRGRVD